MKRVNQLRARVYDIINSRLNRFAKGPLRDFAKPGFLCFKLTERCNSRCVHCGIWHNTDSGRELSKDDWICIINNLRDWTGPANLVITGGEALLRPDALDLVRHACNVGMVVELLSNGIACDHRVCEQIVLSGVDRITFSLDGITPQTHASIRGIPDNFVCTLEAIENIDKHRKKYRSEIKILLKTVLMRENIHEVIAIGDWITSQGKAEWRIQPIEQNYGERDNPLWYKTSDLWITDLKAVTHLVSELKQRKKDGCPLQNDFQSLDYIASYFANPDTYMRAIQSHNLPGLDWTPPANFEVSAAGDVRFSFMLQPAGNLKDSSPKDIWNRRH